MQPAVLDGISAEVEIVGPPWEDESAKSDTVKSNTVSQAMVHRNPPNRARSSLPSADFYSTTVLSYPHTGIHMSQNGGEHLVSLFCDSARSYSPAIAKVVRARHNRTQAAYEKVIEQGK